jgi:hypothetical protein
MERIEFVGGPADGETIDVTPGTAVWHIEDIGTGVRHTYHRTPRQFRDADGNVLTTEYMVAAGHEDGSA